MALTKVDKSVSSTPSIVDNGDATAITIDSSERVGIGTTSPAKTFHISSADPQVLRVESSHSYSGIEIKGSGSSTLPPLISALGDDLLIYGGDSSLRTLIATINSSGVIDIKSGGSASTPSLIFEGDTDTGFFHGTNTLAIATSGSERMRIDSSGEVHINKTSTINNGQLEILAQASHQAIVAKVQTDTNQNFLGYNSSGQVTCYIQGNGNYYFSGTSQSDRDLKENIQSITESSLEKVKQLEPKTFNFKESEGFKTNKKTGFIAQEVAEIFGTENGVATGTDGKKDMGIDSVGLIAHLTKAIQEQQAIIEDLQTQINEVKNGN